MLRLIAAITLMLLSVCQGWSMGTERFGNEPFTDVANYVSWPNVMPVINDAHRVYHTWVNGNENFYFAGDTTALNAALKKFASIKAERLTVVLRPGPGKTSTFKKEQSLPFNWNLHLLGGIARHMSTEELGSNIWDPSPYLHVYVGGAIKLDEIEIPQGVEVLEIADLQSRYAKCMTSKNRGVRGWSCGHIAQLDPYNADSMRKIATLLDDGDDWVKLNAVGALSVFTGVADEVIRKLRTVKTDDKQLQKQIAKSIDLLQKAQPTETARKEFQQSIASIHEFVVTQRQGC
jgi:hypothetical protein